MRIQRNRNALLRWRRRALTYTTRAPARCAARSCAVRPALSKTTTCGRQVSSTRATAADWKVADVGNNVVGNGALAAYGAARLRTNCTDAAGQRRCTAVGNRRAPRVLAHAVGAGYRHE